MRFPFAAGTLRGGTSKVALAHGRSAPPFPGPWTLAAIIRTPYADEAASADSRLSASSVRWAAPVSRTSAARPTPWARVSVTSPT